MLSLLLLLAFFGDALFFRLVIFTINAYFLWNALVRVLSEIGEIGLF